MVQNTQNKMNGKSYLLKQPKSTSKNISRRKGKIKVTIETYLEFEIRFNEKM